MAHTDIESVETVQQYCLEQLSEWEKRPGNPPSYGFSWPMDRIAGKPYGYTIQCSIVEAWNREDRATPVGEFHRKWLSSIENIKTALARKWS